MNPIVFIVVFVFFCISPAAGWAETPSAGMSKRVMSIEKVMTDNGVDKEEAGRMIRLMKESRFSADSMETVRKIMEESSGAGAPVEPLVHKTLEGMAKKMPEDLIVKALKKTGDRYVYAFRHARTLAGSEKDNRKLAYAIADCLSASVTEKDMDQILRKISARIREDRENSVQLAEEGLRFGRTMARLSVASKNVRDVLCLSMINQYSWQEMKEIHHRFSRQAMAGSPDRIAEDYATAMSRGARAGEMGHSPGGYGGSPGMDGSRGPADTGGSGAGGSGYSGSGSGRGGSQGHGSPRRH